MNHAISDARFNISIMGYLDGVARAPMRKECADGDLLKYYQQGYAEGQKERRDYSQQLCDRFGLVNPVVKAW